MRDHCPKFLLYVLFSTCVLQCFVASDENIDNVASSCTENFKCYEEVYFEGTLINIINNVSNLLKCYDLCVDENQCLSLNYNTELLNCELMNDCGDPNLDEDNFIETTNSIYVMIDYRMTENDPLITHQNVSDDNCGESSVSINSSTRIVGGFESAPNAFPWIISMSATNTNRHSCGGSLVPVGNNNMQSDIVITAAHCVFQWPSPNRLAVKFGCNDISKRNCITVTAAAIEVHPRFNIGTLVNDIAIIKLQSPVSFTSKIRPICLPTIDQNMDKPGTVSIAAGWGALFESRPGTTRLMQVELPIVDSTTCNSKNYYNGFVNPKVMICAGYHEGKRGSCQGDSGGPLMVKRNNKYFLAGIVSFGVGCARPYKPAVFVRVSAYKRWIDSRIERLSNLA